MPQSGYILEIGAGAGWQASLLSQKGFAVEAIDIEQSNYSEQRIWPVRDYDGVHIPFADNSFDFVFSSNVLEHILHVEQFQAEIKRVLKPKGIAVHVLPSVNWRFWTNISFYLFRVQQLALILLRFAQKNKPQNNRTSQKNLLSLYSEHGFIKTVIKAVIPGGHGATGNCVSQVYLFSRFCWMRIFRRTGWSVRNCYPNRLFYTGHLLCGSLMSIRTRRIMSYLLGSSCLIYILTKKQQGLSGTFRKAARTLRYLL